MNREEVSNIEPRILIISASPFRMDRQSRFLNSYFQGFSHQKIAQFFSNPENPIRGNCCSYFQITDYRLLLKRVKKNIETGVIFSDNNIVSSPIDNSKMRGEEVHNAFRKIKRWSISRSIREFVWKERYWNSKEFNDWLDDFKPELLFFVVSDETYLHDITKYIQNKFSIPCLIYIADDYYFCQNPSISPLYYLYRQKYKRLFRSLLLDKRNSVMYVSQKMADKYNYEFGLSGPAIHISSNKQISSQYRQFSGDIDSYVYFGNLGLGRYRTLIVFANILAIKRPNALIHLYSYTNNKRITKLLKKHSNFVLHGKVDYDLLSHEIQKYDCILIAEELSKKRIIDNIKYSLTTKLADSLYYQKPLMAIGNAESGIISFLINNPCSFVATDTKGIFEHLDTFYDLNKRNERQKLFKLHAENGFEIYNRLFTTDATSKVFKEFVLSSLDKIKYKD